jgi:hypothetical protein
MPASTNPHAAKAQHSNRSTSNPQEALLQAVLAVAYELRTQNLLKAEEIWARQYHPALAEGFFDSIRKIQQERLSD